MKVVHILASLLGALTLGIGTAIGNELGVAIRDTGSLMDPRSRKDWWQGR